MKLSLIIQPLKVFCFSTFYVKFHSEFIITFKQDYFRKHRIIFLSLKTNQILFSLKSGKRKLRRQIAMPRRWQYFCSSSSVVFFCSFFFLSLLVAHRIKSFRCAPPTTKSFSFRNFHGGNKWKITLYDDIAGNYRLNKMNFMLMDVFHFCFVLWNLYALRYFALCSELARFEDTYLHSKTEILVNLEEYVISSCKFREFPFFEMKPLKLICRLSLSTRCCFWAF